MQYYRQNNCKLLNPYGLMDTWVHQSWCMTGVFLFGLDHSLIFRFQFYTSTELL
jgi:hypothetical protein